jgi:hypothetical protein
MGFSEEMQLFGKEYPYQSITLGRASFRYILAGQKGTPAVVFFKRGMNRSSNMFRSSVNTAGSSHLIIQGN